MEKNDKHNRNIDQLLSKLPATLESAILEKVRFGRSENTSFWVHGSRLLELGEFLKSRGEMDWLENLSCAQVDQNLLLTYFLRSSATRETTILRVSLELPSNHQAFVEMDSMENVWESARPFEEEIFKLFGVRFKMGENDTCVADQTWDGFPLRKDFIINATEGLA